MSKPRKPKRHGKTKRRRAAKPPSALQKTRQTRPKAKSARKPTSLKQRPKRSKPGQKRTFVRRVLIYSGGTERAIKVGSRQSASLVGKYMAAVGWLITHNDPSRLEPFVGKSVRDTKLKRHLLETRPNVLYRLSHSGGSSFEDVYRVVA